MFANAWYVTAAAVSVCRPYFYDAIIPVRGKSLPTDDQCLPKRRMFFAFFGRYLFTRLFSISVRLVADQGLIVATLKVVFKCCSGRLSLHKAK